MNPTTTPAEGDLALLNEAVFRLDWYLIKDQPEDLVKASEAMKAYRLSGGEYYAETEKAIARYVDAAARGD
jgi:hypothetical protein